MKIPGEENLRAVRHSMEISLAAARETKRHASGLVSAATASPPLLERAREIYVRACRRERRLSRALDNLGAAEQEGG